MSVLACEVQLTQGVFTLEVALSSDARVLGLAGPSGSGKTTLLEMLAGLRRPARGRIEVGGIVVFDATRRIDVPAHLRRVGYVPQDGALFPHMTVQANVLYGAGGVPGRTRALAASGGTAVHDHPEPLAAVEGEARRLSARPTLASVAEALDITALLPRPVTQLSGGERQRVALARALMARPRLLLLDEPLSGVDRARKRTILPYLRALRDQWDVPMVYVSHDAEELALLADEVCLLEGGRVVPSGHRHSAQD